MKKPSMKKPAYQVLAHIFFVMTMVIAQSSNAQSTPEKDALASTSKEKIKALLTVGTSASNPDIALGNKQALVAAEVRKQLKADGVPVFAIGIKANEPEIQKVISDAIVTTGVSHTMQLTVLSGLVRMKNATESTSAINYDISVVVNDAKSGALLWSYREKVETGLLFGTSNSEAAKAIVNKMRVDGVL